MKNFLLALLGTTMLSAASAQCDSVAYEFTSGAWDGEITCLLFTPTDTINLEPGTSGTLCLEYNVEYTLWVQDSFQDGWNGAVLTIGDLVFIGPTPGIQIDLVPFVIEVDCDVLTAELEAELAELEAELAECDSVAQAEVQYWMDAHAEVVDAANAYIDSLNAIISAVPATIESIVDPLVAELEAAQECCSSCPAAIETAADNAYANGYADGVEDTTTDVMLSNEEFQQILLDLQFESEVNGYNVGYAQGLEDCEGEVSGLVDIDGTVINVIGYYNQLGQVIDPRTATGVIIRKHDDGTFSKYFK